MLQLVNHTPFASQVLLTANPEGEDIALLCLKATFTLLPKVGLADKQAPVLLSDEFMADPQGSSLLYASECLLIKPGQELVVNGTAYSPDDREVSQFDCSISLGGFSKKIRIFGDRYWHQGNISTPDPVSSMPLTYDHAFGGCHHFFPEQPLSPQSAVYYPQNPIGKGFGGHRQKHELEALPLPNLENPDALITDVKDTVLPWSLGYIPGHWSPRKEYSGTYDSSWQQQRSPLLPLDFDRKFFFNGSHNCQLPAAAIAGGESVELINLARQNRIAFTLPLCEFMIRVTYNGQVSRPELALETLLFEPDHNRFFLLWKTEIPCNKKPLLLEKIEISLLKGQYFDG